MVIGFLVDFSIEKLIINTQKIKLSKGVFPLPPYLKERRIKMLTLTAEMFEGLTSTITSNLGVLLPVGLTIMGIMIAVSLIPRIIYKFF